MMTKLFQCNGSEVLGCQISANTMDDGFVVKEGILAILGAFFEDSKMAMAEEVNLFVTNLVSKICTILLSHVPRNDKTSI